MGQNYSFEWDKKYCYPNSFVLKNKFNILNGLELELAEKEYTSLSIAEIKITPIKGDLDLKHLQNIHKYVFSDIYDWAGELRSVNISKGTSFCNYMYIVDIGNKMFSKLTNENYLIGINGYEIYYKLAYYLGEINALHAFRDGNGRVQRVFIEYLAQVSGCTLDFSKVTDKEMIDASIDAFNCDYDKMTKIFSLITTSIKKEEQEEFIKAMSTKNSQIKKAYNLLAKDKPLE